MQIRALVATRMAAAPLLALALAGCGDVHRWYDARESKILVPMLLEVLAFPTVQGNVEAHGAQQEWLALAAHDLGFVSRPAGLVTEIELPGPAGSPVLGLVVHGDVTAVDERSWSSPPFSPIVKDGAIVGRGAADDKGPLVQALLAMKVLAEAGPPRTHTVRLLVGSDEESGSTDMGQYLASHRAPDYSLVLDSAFPVVAGEKAWNSLEVTTDLAARSKDKPYRVSHLVAGVAASIVPDRAECTLSWLDGPPDWDRLAAELRGRSLPQGTRLELEARGDELRVVVHGRSAHAGVNLEGGRNALVALAGLLDGDLPESGAADLLAFAKMAGVDLRGTGLGITDSDPLWGHYDVNVATILPADRGRSTLTINLRRIPGRTGPQLRQHLEGIVANFNSRRGAALVPGGFFDDEPFTVDPESKLVRRLLAAYRRATGEDPPPSISGGGTYAKRLPNSVAFGMWFPGKPYPGHDSDERVPISDLHRGVHVLLDALVDLACSAPMSDPLKP